MGLMLVVSMSPALITAITYGKSPAEVAADCQAKFDQYKQAELDYVAAREAGRPWGDLQARYSDLKARWSDDVSPYCTPSLIQAYPR